MKATFTILVCLIVLTVCGGTRDSTKSETTTTIPAITTTTAPTLSGVNSYSLTNSPKLLAMVKKRLDNLSKDDFLQFYRILVERKPEDVIADETLAKFAELPITLNNISDEYYFQKNEIKKLINQYIADKLP